jgi:hypothetical protein
VLVDLISDLVEGMIFGGGRRRGLIRGGLLYLLVDLISGLVEDVVSWNLDQFEMYNIM